MLEFTEDFVNEDALPRLLKPFTEPSGLLALICWLAESGTLLLSLGLLVKLGVLVVTEFRVKHVALPAVAWLAKLVLLAGIWLFARLLELPAGA